MSEILEAIKQQLQNSGYLATKTETITLCDLQFKPKIILYISNDQVYSYNLINKTPMSISDPYLIDKISKQIH